MKSPAVVRLLTLHFVKDYNLPDVIVDLFVKFMIYNKDSFDIRTVQPFFESDIKPRILTRSQFCADKHCSYFLPLSFEIKPIDDCYKWSFIVQHSKSGCITLGIDAIADIMIYLRSKRVKWLLDNDRISKDKEKLPNLKTTFLLEMVLNVPERRISWFIDGMEYVFVHPFQKSFDSYVAIMTVRNKFGTTNIQIV